MLFTQDRVSQQRRSKHVLFCSHLLVIMVNKGSQFTLLCILQPTITEHGQLMDKLKLRFIIDEKQQGVQETDQSSRDFIPAFTLALLRHRSLQTQQLSYSVKRAAVTAYSVYKRAPKQTPQHANGPACNPFPKHCCQSLRERLCKETRGKEVAGPNKRCSLG